MKALLTNKYVIVLLVALAITIPLGMIEGLVYERQHYRDSVVTEIGNSSTHAQRIVGPVLVAPCTRSWTETITNVDTGRKREVQKTSDCTRVFLPDELNVDARVDTEHRKRGIYSALVYGSTLQMSASFSVPKEESIQQGRGNISWGASYLAIGIADPRGIINAPKLKLGTQSLPFEAGAGLAVLGSGIRAPLPHGAKPFGRNYDFAFDLKLRGMQNLHFVPVGRQTRVDMQSPWPHPSFVGRYLPESRSVTQEGFSATWLTSEFATDLGRVFNQHVRAGAPVASINSNSFGVSFIEPVDAYTRADRAVKYGFLFVALTFVALVLTEVMQSLRVHPVQYALVGVALSMFFLLLLSLSEHLGFALAYLIASAACVGLLWYYLRHVVPARAFSNAFAAGLASLYAMLYGLLSSEDYALLMGSVLVFAVLAAVMVVTRRVDWYELAGSSSAANSSQPAVGDAQVSTS